MLKSLDWTKKGILPAQHCWGCDYLEKQAKLKYFTHTIPAKIQKLHLARVWYYIQNLIILFKAINCDVIYVAASPLVDLLGFLKYIGLYKKSIVMIIHHPGNFSLKRQRYDRLIFICKKAYKQAIIDYPEFKDIFLFQNWGPDLTFYKNFGVKNLYPSFFSNGNTDRDNYTLIEASKNVNFPIGILCNKQYIPTNYNESLKNIKITETNNGRIMSGKIMPYKQMISWSLQYSICIIPTKKGKTTLCGLTSFCDAIALGMPVLLADTTHIDVDFKKYPFGCYYKAGDVEDLVKKMNWFSENYKNISKMSEISRLYATENDYSKFAKIICKVILK